MSDKTTGEAVIALLSGRKGFDWWWDELDDEIQADIVAELDDLIDDHLSREVR